MRIHQTYEQLTFARVRVMAALSEGEGKTIREAANALGYSYNGMRSQVRDIEGDPRCGQHSRGAGVLGQARGRVARVLCEAGRTCVVG